MEKIFDGAKTNYRGTKSNIWKFYRDHQNLIYPKKKILNHCTNSYMITFQQNYIVLK